MHDKLNENIDDVFRKGLSQIDESDKYESWADMELLLDEDKRKRRFFILWFFGFLGLLSILFLYTFIFKPTFLSKKPEALTQVDFSTSNSIIQNENTPKSSIKEIDGAKDQKTELETIGNKNLLASSSLSLPKVYVNTKLESKSINQGIKHVNPLVNNSIHNIINQEETNINKSHNKRITSKHSFSSDLRRDPIYSDNNVLDIVQSKNNNALGSKSGSENLILDLLKSQKDLFELVKRDLPIPKINALNEVEENLSNFQFLIGLKISREESTSKFARRNDLDTKYGIETTFRFAKKWSFGLGANYVLKKYTSSAYEYSAPPGFWTRSIMPQTIEAECKIIEIPIQIGYYFNGYENNSFFTSAAINSYIMLNEDYVYTYAIPEPDLRKGWSGRNTAQHFLGITDFTLGYQLALNKDFYLQASSYVQVPISKIGFGQVKLWSKGVTVAGFYKL